MILDLGWALNLMTGIFTRDRRGRFGRRDREEDDSAKTEAESEWSPVPRAKEHLGDGRGKEGVSPRALVRKPW